ncbi:MAG: hypothetical protein OXN27_06395 [Candidatus Poribacteria bacterium]|nr:hypothetical protein [Candidatus Poribacteria bacterium]
MLRVTMIALLCIAVVVGAFFVFWAKDQNVHREAESPKDASISRPPPAGSNIRQEAQGHLNKLYALSGRLTPEEKTVYLDNTFALEKLFRAQQGPLLPQAEYERFVAHIEGLLLENPNIGLEAHAETENHEVVYERQQKRQEELENVIAAIEEVKASEDMSVGAKEAFLSILENRRAVLESHGAETREMARVFAALKETDPDIVGLEKNDLTGKYTKVYPNMLTIYKKRIHHLDGTVEIEYAGSRGGATDPDLHQEIEAYVNLLENTPPWETPPPPEHEDLRFAIEYNDVYVDANGKETSAQQQADATVGTPPELPQEYPQPIITEEEVDSWKESLTEFKTSDPAEWEEMQKFFQEAMGIPLDRFLEMTDAEIEAELNRQLSPSQRELVSSATDTSLGLPSEESFKTQLRQRISPARFNQAIEMLSRYGPKEGVRRLKAVDPEVGRQVEDLLQKQEAR